MDDVNMILDMTGVYAYTDSSYARDRELWRGFLSYVLPTVIQYTSENIDHEISGAVVYSTDELTIKIPQTSGFEHGQAIRLISTFIAKEIGVPPEFALASFYEGKLPTKLYSFKPTPIKKKRQAQKEDKLIAGWLVNFAKVQTDKSFLNKTEKWMTWIKKD